MLNTKMNLICYFASFITAFFTRKILLDQLGAEFIGFTGTVGSLLSEVAEENCTDNNYPSFNEGQREEALLAMTEPLGSQRSADRPGERVQETTSCHFEPKGEISTTKENLLPIGTKHNHLLVETSYYNPPMRLHETLRLIKSLGYHLLLAHPERYMYIDNDEYRSLHAKGVKFQLNLPAICGGYGNTVKKRALWLLKEGLYDVIGSDTHCEEGVEYLLESRHSNTRLEVIGNILQRTN